MYEELIRRLREEPLDSNKAALPIMDLCIDAATAIKNLSHRLDMAQGERDAVTRHMIELEQDVCRLKSRPAAYEDTGMEPEEINDMALEVATLKTIESMYDGFGKPDHIRDLLQAEQDGRLVVLPCKVGDHVWADGREAIVVWFFGYKTERYLHAQFLDNAECADIPFYEIGKNRLSAREDAEAAMAKKGDSEQ